MGREIYSFNQALERAKSVVGSVVAEVKNLESNPENELLKEKWVRTEGKLGLPVYTYSKTLIEAGVDEEHIKTLLNLVKRSRC